MSQVTLLPALKFLVDGEEVPIKGFEFRAATPALGAAMNVTLADATAIIDTTKSATFKLGYRNGDDVSMDKLIDHGSIVHENHGVAYRADTLNLSIVDALTDRFSLSPPHPIKLYDPHRTSVTDQERLDYYAVRDSDDLPIRTEFILKPGLNLYQVLDYVFKEKLGFSRAVTNIPNYSVIEVSFPLSQSYMASVSNSFALFEPLITVDQDGVVYIQDILAPLVPGLPIKGMGVSKYTASEKERPAKQVVNAALLTYNVLDLSQFYVGPRTNRVVTDVDAVGVLGEESWHQTVVTRTITELHDDVTDSTKITNEVEFRVVTRVYGKTADGPNTLMSEETQEDTYSPDYKLKTGHTLRRSARLKLPGVNYGFVSDVSIEESQTTWARSVYNPNEFIKVWSSTSVRGLVLYDAIPDWVSPDPFATIHVYPITLANRLKLVDENSDTDQLVALRQIGSTIEYWRETGGGQVDVHVTKVDVLTGVVESTHSINHIADVRVGENDEKHLTRTQLLVDEVSVARYQLRTPIAINAGDVPYDIAREVAQRRLRRAGSPSRRATVQLFKYDPRIRRGTLRTLRLRNDLSEKFIVTGYSIKGELQQNGALKVTQSLEGLIVEDA